jgi:hypothetical protein
MNIFNMKCRFLDATFETRILVTGVHPTHFVEVFPIFHVTMIHGDELYDVARQKILVELDLWVVKCEVFEGRRRVSSVTRFARNKRLCGDGAF